MWGEAKEALIGGGNVVAEISYDLIGSTAKLGESKNVRTRSWNKGPYSFERPATLSSSKVEE